MPYANQTESEMSPSTKTDQDTALAGDRGAASGRNIAQNRAIGQDDPVKGSRMGKKVYLEGEALEPENVGTNPAQIKEAENLKK